MIYADSSVIVKRYYEEPGTARVREGWGREDRVFTSKVSYAEVHAALARKHRERGISPWVFGRRQTLSRVNGIPTTTFSSMPLLSPTFGAWCGGIRLEDSMRST
jgi:predicted nucleic acid-binding protein